MIRGRVRLSAEDRSRFSEAVKTASPSELLTVIRFLEDYGNRIAPEDMRFINSHIGRRAERLLRNVALYQSWDGPESGKETMEG